MTSDGSRSGSAPTSLRSTRRPTYIWPTVPACRSSRRSGVLASALSDRTGSRCRPSPHCRVPLVRAVGETDDLALHVGERGRTERVDPVGQLGDALVVDG